MPVVGPFKVVEQRVILNPVDNRDTNGNGNQNEGQDVGRQKHLLISIRKYVIFFQ